MQENFKNQTTAQLKKRAGVLLGISIVGLLAMIGVLIWYFYGVANGNKNECLIFIVPVILGPLSIFPALVSSQFRAEVKRRGQ